MFAPEPVYRIRVDAPPPNVNQHNSAGALIEFNTGASAEEVARAQAFLDRLAERGIIKQTRVRTFNSNIGQPTWYIP